MGYMIAMGACATCGKIISFNPERVPSVRINGVKEPVCRTCIERENARRAPLNDPKLPPLTIMPGAYDETECA